ncbi:acetylornithine deacetylase or succinyl-diaminopimelate desuccinylase [Bacillus freudenreichii]|nr:acetylornithine deacetylase or succinyl-diaminopimelate desuccinylase [Bacillus freudenreichii]
MRKSSGRLIVKSTYLKNLHILEAEIILTCHSTPYLTSLSSHASRQSAFTFGDSVKTSSEHPFVQLVQNVVKTVDGSTELGGMTGYTDGSQFIHAQKEFPIIVLGPGKTSLAHQPDEYVEIDKYLNSINLYKEIANKFLS